MDKLKIKFFQGSNLNVLSRFYHILNITKAKSIVRITADCPLIDAKVIDQVIKFQKRNVITYLIQLIELSLMG